MLVTGETDQDSGFEYTCPPNLVNPVGFLLLCKGASFESK